jgi:hypothetical protein
LGLTGFLFGEGKRFSIGDCRDDGLGPFGPFGQFLLITFGDCLFVLFFWSVSPKRFETLAICSIAKCDRIFIGLTSPNRWVGCTRRVRADGSHIRSFIFIIRIASSLSNKIAENLFSREERLLMIKYAPIWYLFLETGCRPAIC